MVIFIYSNEDDKSNYSNLKSFFIFNLYIITKHLKLANTKYTNIENPEMLELLMYKCKIVCSGKSRQQQNLSYSQYTKQ